MKLIFIISILLGGFGLIIAYKMNCRFKNTKDISFLIRNKEKVAKNKEGLVKYLTISLFSKSISYICIGLMSFYMPSITNILLAILISLPVHLRVKA